MPSFLVSRLRGRTWAAIASAGVAATLLVVAALGRAGGAGAAGAGNGPTGIGAGDGHLVVLPGELPPAQAHARRGGREGAANQLQLSIGLQPSDRAGLLKLLKDQQDPRSPRYHHYLAPQAYAAAYGPPPTTVAAVRAFLQRAGLRVTSVSKGNQLIDATGSVPQVEQAFGIHLYSYTLGKRSFAAPDHDPLIPENLAASILNVGGLDTLFHMSPRISAQIRSPSRAGGGAAPRAPASCVGTPPAGAFGPAQLQGAYDVSNLLNAIGAAYDGDGVAVFELAPYLPGDLANYRCEYGLPDSFIQAQSVDRAPVTGDGPGTIEADLDLEVISAIAPWTSMNVYGGPNTTQGVNDTFQTIAADIAERVVTTSWGLCEAFTGQAELNQLDTIFQEYQGRG